MPRSASHTLFATAIVLALGIVAPILRSQDLPNIAFEKYQLAKGNVIADKK